MWTDLSISSGRVCQAHLPLATGTPPSACSLVVYMCVNGITVYVCIDKTHSAPNACPLTAANPITQRVSVCVGWLAVVFQSCWGISAPQVQIYCSIPHAHTNAHIHLNSLRRAYAQETACSGMSKRRSGDITGPPDRRETQWSEEGVKWRVSMATAFWFFLLSLFFFVVFF